MISGALALDIWLIDEAFEIANKAADRQCVKRGLY